MAEKESYNRAIWGRPEPGKLLGKGHPAGDLLEAYEWDVVEEREGFLRLDVHLPDPLKNFRGVLFGGFAPAYVDLVALRTVSAGRPLSTRRGWLLTVNMRVDYLEPVAGPRFFIESEIRNRRGSMILVETRFLDADKKLLLFAITTLKELNSS